jgi:chloramphenicol 3-O-phosphotransferase
MFEYEGNEYSLEDVKLAASNLNMGFDEYVKKYNLKEKGKASGVAQQDAAVTPQPEIASESMDSKQENGSLDLEKLNDKEFFAEFGINNVDIEDDKDALPYTRSLEEPTNEITIESTGTRKAQLPKATPKEYIKKVKNLESTANVVLNSNTPYQLDIEGGSISELSEDPSFFDNIRSEIKEAHYRRFPNGEFPSDYDIDNIVKAKIKKLSKQEAEQKQNSARALVEDALEEGSYDFKLNTGAKLHISEVSKEAKNLANLIRETREQQKILQGDGTYDEKLAAQVKLKELSPLADEALNTYNEDLTFMFDNKTGQRLTKPEVEAKNSAGEQDEMTNLEGELNELEGFYKDLDLESLEQAYFGHVLEYEDYQKNRNSTIDLKPTDGTLAIALSNYGYEAEDGVFKNVKYSDLMNFQDQEELLQSSIYNPEGGIIPQLGETLKSINKDRKKLNLEREAFKTAYLLNIDPGSIEQSKTSRFFEAATEATIGTEATERIGTTARKELDALEGVFSEAGITMTEDQKKNFERSFGMNVAEGVGAFMPELVKFALANKVAGAAGITRLIANAGTRATYINAAGQLVTTAKKANKPLQFTLGALLEEAKFKAVTEGESQTGGGVGFFAGGALMRKALPFRFQGDLARFNPFLEKVVLAGPGGAVGSEAALFTEAVYKDVVGNKDFRSSMEEEYGDLGEVGSRVAVNMAVFSLIGGLGLKKLDIKSIAEKRSLLEKTQNELDNDFLKKRSLESTSRSLKEASPFSKEKLLTDSEVLKKQNLVNLLKSETAVADRAFNKLDIASVRDNMNAARVVLNSSKSTKYEIEAAKKIINQGTASIAAAQRQVNRQFNEMRKSGILGDKVSLEIVEGGEKTEGSKALYDPISKKFTVDILKYKPGVFAHEVGHAFMDMAFKANPELAKQFKDVIKNDFNKALQGKRFDYKGKKDLTFEEAIDFAYGKDVKAEEYVMNAIEFLQNPKYADLLLNKGLLPSLKRTLVNTGRKAGLDLSSSLDLSASNSTRASQLLEFMYSMGRVSEGGSARGIKKSFEKFSDISIDGNKLVDTFGNEITQDRVDKAKASKDLETSASKLAEKYKNNKEGMTPKELADFKDQYVRLGVEAVSRWAAKKGVPVSAIKGNPEIAGKVLDQFESVTRNYKPVNPKTGKKVELSTYMQSFLGVRVGPKIVEEYSRKLETTSTDTEFAREIVDQSSSEALAKRKAKEEAEAKDLIDVREFTPVRIKRELIEESVDLEPGFNKLTYKTAANDYSPKVAEALLDMPYDRATGKSTLNYGKGGGAAEVSRMQGLFRNVQEFKKFMQTMPEYNVSGLDVTLKTLEGQERIADVSPEAKGYATGLNNKLLKLMYDKVYVKIPGVSSPKGRSLGKTSQVQVWRLKPEFRKPSVETLRKLQQDIGITPAGELSIPMKGANRTKFGTLLQGLTKVYVDNVTNKVIRSKIEESGIKTAKGTDQIIADIAAGTSKRMASEVIEEAKRKLNKFKPSLISKPKDIKMYEEGEADFYNAIASGMKVEKAFNESFDKTFLTKKDGTPLNAKNDLIKSIEYNVGEYDRASRALSKGTEPKPLQRYLFEQVSEQRAQEQTKEMLGVGRNGIDFNNPEQVNTFVRVFEKALGKKNKTDAEIAEIGAFLVKAYSANAKLGSGLLRWAETDAGIVLELSSGKTGTTRQSAFGKAEDFINLVIKPNMSNPEAIKVVRKPKNTKEGVKMEFSHIEFDGKRIDVKRAKQSSTATSSAIKEYQKEGKISKETLDASLEYANANRDLYVDILEQFKKNGDNNATGMFLSSSTSSMEGLLRAAANLNSIATKGKDFNPDNYRYEHNPPANVMKVYSVDYINGNITKSQLRAKLNDYSASIIPKEMDNIINEKYQSSLPLEALINPWKRYYNFSHYGRNITELTLYEKQADGSYTTVRKGAGFEQAYKDAQSAIESNTSSKASKEFFEKPKSVQESIENLKSLDKALKAGNDVKAPVKKIRVFDFDDTLARSNSRVNYTAPNVEGGFSQGANKYKAIFMVGGPGAGKTNIGKGLQLGRRGFKVVNQDIALEAMKEEAGLPARESEYTKEQRSMRSKLGAAARKAAVAKFDKYAKNGDGMVVDGTGASYNATMKKVKQLEDAGFEVHMVVANTPLETAISRNQARVERSLPDFVVRKTWEQVQESAKRYREEFGDRLYEIETTDIGFGEALPERFLQKVYSGITRNKVGKINASEFAKQADLLESQGAKFDFKEFSKVVDGKKGPLFSVAEKIAAARGTEDVFILTARPPESAIEIQKFMKEAGIDIPLENITGLGDGTAKAKAKWVLNKAGEGYNDFYFADDAIKNVKAVKQVLSQIDVKSKVQQAKASKDIDLSKTFNEYLEVKTGIGAQKKYARVKGEVAGKGKGKLNFFVPYSANDFTGLLYTTLAKGKKGEAQMKFYKETMLDPYARAMNNISRDRVAMLNDFNALKKQISSVPKNLRKKLPGEPFTQEQAIRVNIWSKQGMEVPGLSKADLKSLNEFVEKSPELNSFSEQIVNILKGDQYAKPGEGWVTGTITTDLLQTLNTTKRAKYLEPWKQNVSEIFSDQNLNKLEAAFGKNYRSSMESILKRMETGRNRGNNADKFSGKLVDWLTGSIGVTMFFNTRSAVLQTLSSFNYLNFKDNNIFAAGKAFANQKQYWKDFSTLMNSDFLKERRSGLRINVNEADIADMAKKGGVRGVVNKLLEFGFTPTQVADSFAIASGGSTYYRNRIKKYVKEGMSEVAAEKQALKDWREISEENQQSSRPDRISAQQASDLGRVVLAFANTPMQYNRIMKKAYMDLKDGRGSKKENISKILYYGAVQNLIFNALQNALFAIAFDEDDEMSEKQKQDSYRALNGMADSVMRGSGYVGAIASVLKNTAIKLNTELDKKRPNVERVLVSDLLKVSPPLSAKVSQIQNASRAYQWNKDEMKEKGFSLDNPAYLAGGQVISAATNVPLDRLIKKINNIDAALGENVEEWQRIALLAGWNEWNLGMQETSKKTKKSKKTKRTKTRTLRKRILR